MQKKELELKEIQEESFKVLIKLKEILESNNLKYFLAYGTLLGAARHKGFIPWDDDIDIWMPRDDYEKLINYCKIHKEDLYPLELFHYKTNDKYIYPIARFSNCEFKVDYYNVEDYGLGVFVDIYPLDGIDPNDKKYLNKIEKLTKKVFLMGEKRVVSKDIFPKKILKIIRNRVLKLKRISKEIEKLDIMSQKYRIKESSYVNCVCWNFKDVKYKKESIIGKETKLPFNGVEFSVPTNYKDILNTHYGDYMKLPKKSEQIPHHFYSVYKK